MTSATTVDLDEVRRAEYPSADRALYFDAASFGALPLRSLRTLDALNRRKHEPHTPAEGGRVAAIMAEAVERCARRAR